MKHPSICELFRYWNDRRGQHLAPERADIEPNDIRSILADVFILSVDPGRGYPFRIAGTRVCALFGRELKNEGFLNLWSGASRDDIRTLLSIITDETVGVVANLSAVSAAEAGCSLELLLLPLRHHCQTDGRVLGALATREAPPWLGTPAPTNFAIGTRRYVGTSIDDQIGSPAFSAPQGVLRHRFVVYDGGKA
jgi:hypothetical protein